jgi:TRAP-type mannitol/chloroaromatic compound transport system substrate-binding protein
MPRAAQLRKMREVRDFFQERFASTIEDPKEARAELTSRFNLTQGQWYNLVPQFKRLIREAKEGGNGTLVAEADLPPPEEPQEQPQEQVLEIPANLAPAAKAIVNALLAKNQELAAEIHARDAEINAQRERIVVQTKRATLLKKIVYDTVEAL